MPEQQMRNVVLRAALEDCCSGLARVVDDVQRFGLELEALVLCSPSERSERRGPMRLQCSKACCTRPVHKLRSIMGPSRSPLDQSCPMPAKGATNVEDGFFPGKQLNARRGADVLLAILASDRPESTRV